MSFIRHANIALRFEPNSVLITILYYYIILISMPGGHVGLTGLPGISHENLGNLNALQGHIMTLLCIRVACLANQFLC